MSDKSDRVYFRERAFEEHVKAAAAKDIAVARAHAELAKEYERRASESSSLS